MLSVSLDILFVFIGLLGIFLWIRTPPPLLFISNLNGFANPSVRNWSVGKPSSILLSVRNWSVAKLSSIILSVVIRTSNFNWSNLEKKELILILPKNNLSLVLILKYDRPLKISFFLRFSKDEVSKFSSFSSMPLSVFLSKSLLEKKLIIFSGFFVGTRACSIT